jgi:hypothetical protein
MQKTKKKQNTPRSRSSSCGMKPQCRMHPSNVPPVAKYSMLCSSNSDLRNEKCCSKRCCLCVKNIRQAHVQFVFWCVNLSCQLHDRGKPPVRRSRRFAPLHPLNKFTKTNSVWCQRKALLKRNTASPIKTWRAEESPCKKNESKKN